MSYDIIGDIHGCAESLEALLEKLGYVNSGEKYSHPSRKVIFLGDFIDRGPYQRRVLDIVRPMIEQGAALSVMGNHEFNAIAYFTPDPAGGYLRNRAEKNRDQHEAFLEEYEQDQDAWAEVIDWFKTLPLWLDLEGIRVVHACWDSKAIGRINVEQNGNSLLSDDLLHSACQKSTWQYEAIETLLKGKEIKLPDGNHFKDKDGNHRHHIRVRWWDQQASTYKRAFMGPESALTHIPHDPIDGDHLIEYGHHEKPVFLGHYWMEGEPSPLAPNIACLDYSVAKRGGKLAAYRWDVGQPLNSANYITVDRQEMDHDS